MSNVWETLIEVQENFIESFNRTGTEIYETGMDRFNSPGWVNRVWTSDTYRRAHIDVVDARQSKGLWMMHCCVFPHTHNPAPIFGFDVIAGKSKITGCFYDYSPTSADTHPLMDWFADESLKLEWHKRRAMPDWAARIFSPYIVAAANVSDPDELAQIINMAHTGIDTYLMEVGATNNTVADVSGAHNFYCENQKKNPHTPKVMTSLGLNEDDVQIFIEKCLFPEI